VFVEERQQRIIDRLAERGKVTVEELTGDFGVSAPTVRADLAALEARGLLRRTHGGALAAASSLFEPPYAERAVAQSAEKGRIGRAAADLIAPGETVILDAGTTTHEIGLALAASGKAGVTVVTNNLPTALALMEAPGIEVIVIGGQAQSRRRAMLGPLATAFLAPFRADRLFLGVSGVHQEAGFTAIDFDAAQVKQAMIAHAAEVIAVADHSKIGQAAFAHVAPLAAASLLLTDGELTPEAERALLDAGIPQIRRA
jgi:DeoR/GlpR family transcriptional regulator of sugar metabolism